MGRGARPQIPGGSRRAGPRGQPQTCRYVSRRSIDAEHSGALGGSFTDRGGRGPSRHPEWVHRGAHRLPGITNSGYDPELTVRGRGPDPRLVCQHGGTYGQALRPHSPGSPKASFGRCLHPEIRADVNQIGFWINRTKDTRPTRGVGTGKRAARCFQMCIPPVRIIRISGMRQRLPNCAHSGSVWKKISRQVGGWGGYRPQNRPGSREKWFGKP